MRNTTSTSSYFYLRDKMIADKVFNKLKAMKLDIKLMHVCGTHQDTLIKHGLDHALKMVGIEIRQGPGCPVCVTTQREIEECILLAKKGKTVTAFGDMMHVPGKSGSLYDWKARGCDVRIVYSIDDAVALAKSHPEKEVVFMGIGFETTAPGTAATLLSGPPDNLSILCCHRTVPNALKAIIEIGEVQLDGLIEPGHVSTIIGTKPYEFISKNYHVPQVIAGFEPLDLLMGIYMLARQISRGEAIVENEYSRTVKTGGNPVALKMLRKAFTPCDVAWRGFPVIAGSGLAIRKKYSNHDARSRYGDDLCALNDVKFNDPRGCKCGEVLRGLIYSDKCPLFRKRCKPETPVGPCMVSSEGSCNILYRYGHV